MKKNIKNLGKKGIIYRRGQQIVLENEKSGEHVAVKVVMHDSMQLSLIHISEPTRPY